MSVFLAGVRRFLTLLAWIAAVTAVISILLGLATGAGIDRAVSLGYYLVGSFMVVAGFFIGNRGPARLDDEGRGPFGQRRLRWATLEERTGTLNDSAVFVSIGFALILLGLIVDQRASLI